MSSWADKIDWSLPPQPKGTPRPMGDGRNPPAPRPPTPEEYEKWQASKAHSGGINQAAMEKLMIYGDAANYDKNLKKQMEEGYNRSREAQRLKLLKEGESLVTPDGSWSDPQAAAKWLLGFSHFMAQGDKTSPWMQLAGSVQDYFQTGRKFSKDKNVQGTMGNNVLNFLGLAPEDFKKLLGSLNRPDTIADLEAKMNSNSLYYNPEEKARLKNEIIDMKLKDQFSAAHPETVDSFTPDAWASNALNNWGTNAKAGAVSAAIPTGTFEQGKGWTPNKQWSSSNTSSTTTKSTLGTAMGGGNSAYKYTPPANSAPAPSFGLPPKGAFSPGTHSNPYGGVSGIPQGVFTGVSSMMMPSGVGRSSAPKPLSKYKITGV